MKKKLMAGLRISLVVLIVILMALSMLACGTKKTESTGNTMSAVDMLNTVWEKTSKGFAAFGGSYQNSVEDAPGTIDPKETDVLGSMLLVPEDVQSHVTDGASLFHMMNTNTFTGAALKLEGIEAQEAAEKIKESFLNNPFMCGFPDKIVIYTVNNDVIYFFGASEIVDEFKTAAGTLEGAKLAVEENY